MRIHNPIFSDDLALYIIWHEEPPARQFSLAAGTFRAMDAAWEAVQDQYPGAELRLQHGARVVKKRDPLRSG